MFSFNGTIYPQMDAAGLTGPQTLTGVWIATEGSIQTAHADLNCAGPQAELSSLSRGRIENVEYFCADCTTVASAAKNLGPHGRRP